MSATGTYGVTGPGVENLRGRVVGIKANFAWRSQSPLISIKVARIGCA